MIALESDALDSLFAELRSLIDETRALMAATVNANLTMLYWRIGKHIHEDVLREERAAYGEQLIVGLSQRLAAEYGRGFSTAKLRRMIQFAVVFPDEQIVVSVIRQLSWTHFLALLPLEDPLQREFYAQMCRIEGWSVRTLREKIDSMLFKRTALSRKPTDLIRQELTLLRAEDHLTPDLVFHDPYLLDFLGLHDHYLEKDLEDAILRDIDLLELPPKEILRANSTPLSKAPAIVWANYRQKKTFHEHPFVTIQPVCTVTVTLSGVKRSRRVLALHKQRFLTSLHSLHSFRYVRNDG